MARRSRLSGFLTGFQSGYELTEKVMRDKGLADIEKAKPEELQGFTAEDGKQLEAAAASGQYDIGTKTNDDGTFAGYTVTPKADPSQVGVIAARGVTDFLGQRTEGSMSDRQVDRARIIAQAGVLSKNGDVQGAQRLRREAAQGERDDLRFDREQTRWKREDQKEADEDAYKSERQRVMGELRFSTITGEHNKAMQEYLAAQKQYEADKAAGKAVGVAPTAPVKGEYTLGDRLADHARLLEVGAKYGKVDEKSMMDFVGTYQKLQQEGYVKALQIAQSGGTAEQIAAAFNESGGIKLDPKTLTIKDAPGKKGEPPSKIIQFPDGQGRTRTIAVLAELDSLGQADKVFTRFYQGNQDRRADNADGRAASAEGRAADSFKTEKDEKKAKTQAAVDLFKQNNPNATPAQLEAVRTGILSAKPEEPGISTKVEADGVGGSIVTQSDKKGNVTATNLDSRGKPKGQPLQVPAPGQAAAPKPQGKPQGKPTKGQEQVIQAGPNKGKTAVYDGTGWVLKP